MGTRSITRFVNPDRESETHPAVACHIAIFRSSDGYPSCQGALLVDILRGVVVCNGHVSGMPRRRENGMGRIAARVVAGMWEADAEPEVRPHGAYRNCNYVYDVWPESDVRHGGWSRLMLRVTLRLGSDPAEDEVLFDGLLDDYDAKDPSDEEDDDAEA
jgi:hypothetical protein